MSRRHELIEAFEAYLDAHADEDGDDETAGEAYADLVVEVAADITRQSPVVEVSYDRATSAVVAVYHFMDGVQVQCVDVLLYAQLTHDRERMHQRAQAAEAMVERLIIAGATALARAEPSATLSYEPSTHRLLLKYPRGREVRHHVCGVPGHIARLHDNMVRPAARLVAAADACDRAAEREHPSSRSAVPLTRYINALKRLREALERRLAR